MRFLWSLPKAAPAILRHLIGYVELAGHDLESTHQDLKSRLLASVVLGVAIFFVILTACLMVVALTWDTVHRVTAIVAMGGVFSLIAIFAALYRSRVIGVQSRFLATVRREWAEDRVILEKILADQD